MLRLLCGDGQLGIPASISFGTMYGAPGTCPTDLNPHEPCQGAYPFRTIVTLIGFVSLFLS